MGIFARVVRSWIQRSADDVKSEFIFYKIVDLSKDGTRYLMQCLNTYGMFYSSLNEIVLDLNILYSLHPVQACYIGIEYVMRLSSELPTYELHSRYGLYQLSHFDRKNNIGFLNKKTLEEFSMSVEKIAFSESIIEEFDAIEAFYIGLIAGENIANINPAMLSSMLHKRKQPHLRVIKGDK